MEVNPIEELDAATEASRVHPEHEALLNDIRLAFRAAEAAMTEVSFLWSGLLTPAVNELRYAGMHILVGLHSADSDASKLQFEDALDHCRRAEYDAWDAGLVWVYEEYDGFLKDTRSLIVSDVIQNWSEVKVDLEQTLRRFNETRKTEGRERLYDDIRGSYARLKNYVDVLNASRDDLTKQEKKKNLTLGLTWAGIIIGLPSSLLAVMLILSYFGLVSVPEPADAEKIEATEEQVEGPPDQNARKGS